MSNISNEKSDVIWRDDEDEADGNRGDDTGDGFEKKNNTVDRIMMLIAVLVLILVHVYVVSDISSFLSYIISSLRVGMILALPTRFNEPIEIPTANIDTVVPNGIILENYYVLSLFWLTGVLLL